jgi:hypothetical protein
MSGQFWVWGVGAIVLLWLVIEFITGFGAYLSDKTPDERNDQRVLRRAGWFGVGMVTIAVGSWGLLFWLRG